jgi:DNA mismatch repair protein MutH
VPIHAEREVEIAWRMVGRAVLWSPNHDEERRLRADWLAHMLAIQNGAVDNIRGSDGEWLQVRPKAAHSGVRTESVDADGGSVLTLPRGFYLRREFTRRILERHLV